MVLCDLYLTRFDQTPPKKGKKRELCEIFQPLAEDLIGSPLNQVGSGPPVRDSFLGPKWLIGCSPSA